MKFTAFFATVALAMTGAIVSAATNEAATPTSLKEALEAVQAITPPAGVTFTGKAERVNTDNKKEQWIGTAGLGLGLGLGGLGPWGGFGPYRFGFNCGGIGGWAYPLSYWNAFGAGIYGGGCGLGFPLGGLYYC
jgi:hypothetical protein